MWIDYFLATFFSFVAIFYTILILFKQSNSPQTKCVHLGEKYSAHWRNHVTFRVFRSAILLYVIARMFLQELDQYFIPFEFMITWSLQVIGAGMMLSGFGIALVSNMSLKMQWRSGIDEKDTAKLITAGLYSLSRNPAYVGVAIAQIGFFLALPNVFTLLCTVVGLWALQSQLELEEAHLSSTFGSEYEQYTEQVPRWL